MKNQKELALGDPLSPEALKRQQEKDMVKERGRNAAAILDLYPTWGCDDPAVVKEHHHVAMSLVIRKLKDGVSPESMMKEVRQYRALIKERGWPRKRIMSPLTFFRNDLRKRVALGQVPDDPVTKFARDARMPIEVAEELNEQD